jgi:hypothetical protein
MNRAGSEKNGRRVRMTSATTSSVSSDSTNQVVRKTAGVAWKTRISAAKVNRSNAELRYRFNDARGWPADDRAVVRLWAS